MNILVTGIHGFVGSNLVVALKERHSLYGLDIVAPEKEGVVKTFSWKDIEPASFPMRNLPEFDAIIHLAGKAHDTKNRSRLAAPAVLYGSPRQQPAADIEPRRYIEQCHPLAGTG